MKDFEKLDYRIFDLFNNQWALVTAGTPERYNTCTIGWGSLGSIWGGSGGAKPIVTVYIHPSRYTCEFMRESDVFTVSFFPKQYKKALGYLGSHSGRDGDKVSASGLTPRPIGDGVTFAEAELTLVCKKLAWHQYAREELSDEIRYDVYHDGDPHWEFIGEILGTEDKR